MEMGEAISADQAPQLEDKCVICGTKHKEPKKENIQKTAGKSGWERDKNMVGIFETGDAERRSIYPNSAYPPPYPTEGHHCLAFTSFVEGGKDVSMRLNHYLNKVGFAPNQPKNIIHLPGRTGAASPGLNMTWPSGVAESYKNFWISIDLGKPLQLHVGRHAPTYFGISHSLVGSLETLFTEAGTCKEKSTKELEDKLKELAEAARNYAFMQVAEAQWICHPEHLRIATDMYSKAGKHSYIYKRSSGKTRKLESSGYGGTGNPPPPWTSLNLDTGPF